MKTTTDFQLVATDKLIPYVNNARTHSPEQIKKLRSSLREFGFVNPVIIDREYNVIAGHGRLMAAKEEGITEVPCVYVDHLTDAQKKAYILADNRMAMDAGWDEELLAVEMQELQDLGYDLSMTGFDEKELADLFSDGTDSEAKDDDFDLTAALEKASFVERGDVWTVGRHRLMCGDATSPEDVNTLMGDTKANLILTDPPYGVSFKSASGLTIQNDSIPSPFTRCCRSSLSCGDSTWRRRQSLKKHRKIDRPMTTPLFLLRCKQLGLTLTELDMLTIGLINDMFTERENDDFDGWHEVAGQADFDAF